MAERIDILPYGSPGGLTVLSLAEVIADNTTADWETALEIARAMLRLIVRDVLPHSVPLQAMLEEDEGLDKNPQNALG